MDREKIQNIGFIVILIIIGVVVGLMWWPFWQLLALAGIIAVLFSPLHKKIKQRVKNSNLATIISLFLVILIIMIPLWLVGQLVFNEIADVYSRYRLGQMSFSQADFIRNLPPAWQTFVQSVSNDASAIVSKISANAFSFVSQMLSNLAAFFMSLFLLIFMVFFMLRDSEKIKAALMDLSPLSEDYEHILLAKIESAIAGVVTGSFLIALIQGLVATVGFTIFGVPNPILWGALTVIAALVPTVGTSLAVIPAVLYLLITGHIGAGIGLLIWGALAVGLIDNVVSPKLVGSKLKMHPLLVLLSIIGGLQAFGFLGFLFGPILMAVFITLLDIYRTQLKK
jgi:predicted PurR-regulated permease PerM